MEELTLKKIEGINYLNPNKDFIPVGDEWFMVSEEGILHGCSVYKDNICNLNYGSSGMVLNVLHPTHGMIIKMNKTMLEFRDFSWKVVGIQ